MHSFYQPVFINKSIVVIVGIKAECLFIKIHGVLLALNIYGAIWNTY